MTPLKFEYDQLTEEFICELDDKTVMIISGGNRGTWAQHFNAQKPTDTVTITKDEYDALVADAERYRWLRDVKKITIDKSTLKALMTFAYWCEPIELDQAIDSARKTNHD